MKPKRITSNQKSLNKTILAVFTIVILFFSNTINAQTPTISGTNGASQICGDCVPPGWVDATGTPDVSNRDKAGGNFLPPLTGGNLGYGATWVNAPLPLPPTGHVSWISLRDVGPDFPEESVSTTITGLQTGKLYKLTMYTMSPLTNNDGNGGNYYAGTKMDQFDYQIDNNAKQSLLVLSETEWGATTFIFIATGTTAELKLFPRKDGGYTSGGNPQLLETVNISINDVNAIERLDTDGDGIFDDEDIDDDNDGIPDTVEYGGLDFEGDTDGDGVPNYLDNYDDVNNNSNGNYQDNNNDGIPDVYDFDGDGVPNHVDLDSDNDGILDNVEAQGSSFVFPTGSVGTNGLYDIYEDTNDSGTTNLPLTDSDTGTGFDDNPDYLDIDSDQDGIPDNIEAQSTLGYTAPSGGVGINGVYSSYENVDTYAPTALTPVNTDNADNPDYRDTDADNDGTSDLDESGLGNTISSSDGDGDGLNNNHDNTDTNDVSNFDATNGITTPSSTFTDTDIDVNSGGDVDYRDDVNGLDTDGDKIPDVIDIDDDDDGIPDDQECVNAAFPASGANAITVDVGVNQETEILNGINGGGDGARMNNTSDVLVVQLRAGDAIVPAGTLIVITTTASNTADKQLRFQQSDAAGNNTSNNWNVTYNMTPAADQDFTGSGNGTVHTVNYTLATDATHIKVTMPTRSGGRINIDYLEYQAFNICTSGDTDGDGIIDSLDIDSDNDGILDNVEAQSTTGYVAKSGNDTDNDGLDDAYDDNLSGASGSNGITIAELINTDGGFTNSDTIPDYLDIDSDNDGIPDNIEAQSTTTYIAPNGVTKANGMDSAYSFNDSFANTGLSSSLVNTDSSHPTNSDTIPDYRDPDADGDGTNDVDEGLSSITAGSFGTDTDGDGLDDIYEHGTTNDGFIVNDGITAPKTSGLIDADADVNTGGDVDYRDTLAGTDTDGDGIVDSVDIDDDNDGILDTIENTCADGTSIGTAFTSLGQARTVSSAGVYFFNLNGNAFSTYVDTNGYVQIAVDFGNGSGNLPQGTSLTNATRGILTPTVLATLTDATSIRISHSGGNLDITTTNATLLSRIVSNTTLHQGTADNTINNDWTGTEATAITVDASCTTSSGTTLNQNIAHLCGNTSGYHWLPSDGTQRIRHSSGSFTGEIANGESFTLWVQAPSATVCSDFDGDGIINSLDQDSDGDGILDNVEAQTIAGYQAPPTTGIAAAVGANGLFSIYENNDTPSATGLTPNVTTATDITPDYLDIDTDDDGIPDNVEAQTTQGYITPTGNVGLNGVDTAYENNDTFTATGITIINSDSAHTTNSDTIPDYRDTDADGDTILDSAESGITPNAGSLGTDSDGDGLDDIYEGSDKTAGEAYDVNDEINSPVNNLLDADNDGGNTGDVDYRDTNVVLDNDNDGIIDSVDLDDDNDGILDTVEGPGDTDSDGIIDAFDIDSDNDGIPDNIEAQSTTGYIPPSGSGAGITDVNNDGVDDNYAGGLTPVNTDAITGNNADATPDYLDADSDGDGTNDILENGNANTLTGTDTDGDGYDDAFEGVLNDQDVNDNINDPATDLPDQDSDVAITDGAQPNAAEYNDVDYRDIDDDRSASISPGHVLWLRSDIGLAGATASTWFDQAGAAQNAIANNSPTINSSGLNFNPTVVFNGSNQDLQITNGIFGNTATNAYEAVWIYAVSKRTTGSNDAYVFSHDVDGANTVALQAPQTASTLSFSPGTGGNTLTNDWGGTNGTFNLWNAGFDNAASLPSSARTAIYRDGRSLNTNTNTGSFGGDNGNTYIGSRNGSNDFLNGEIAELMVYTSVPTSAEQQQIQSYLAIKYGITLDNIIDTDATIVEGDYTLLDGTKIWDKSANNTYHNDIAGIGREDGMLLTQKQSKSINSDAVITIGLNSIAETNTANSGSINSNKSFLVWGNNGSTLTGSTTKTLICAPEKQLDRIWKIVETGSIGTVQIAMTEATVGAFNINTVLNTANTIKVLKIADDATFTTNVKHLPLTSIDINGTNHLVANFDFNGTKYFTYSEINGIFWNGDSAAWKGGAGTGSSPSTIAADIDKVLVIDAEVSLNNTSVIDDAKVECVWVKPNTKLVINDGHYLEFDEDFLLEGEIRLIGDAQLVQKHTGVSNVQGNGKLYRDQKAYVPNTYRYHYWTSPVVASLGNTTFTVSDIMKDGTTPTSENSTIKNINFATWNGQLSSLNGAPTDPITIASYWIFSYFNGATRDDWVQKGHTGNINVGEGFIMKSTGRNPQNFTFVGTPNDGTISKTVNAGTSSLVGNPYPSVIDTQKFIQDNSTVIDGTLYFWEHTGESTTTDVVTEGHGKYGYEGGYSQRNEAMGVAANSVTSGTSGLGDATYTAPPQFIAVGQGFFVSAPSNKGGTFSFENSQRVYSANNHFFKGKNAKVSIPNFKLGFDYTNSTNAKIHRQLGINFKEGNTFNYESGFDSQTFDLQSTDIYWNFPEVQSNLIIAGVGAIDAQLQIPIGIQIDSDKPVKISIDTKESMDGYNIYLIDLLTGQIFDLALPKELNLTKGTYTDRFALIFGGTALGIDSEDILNKLLIFADNSSNEIVIKNNNNRIINKVEMYTVLGQKVKNWKNLETKFENRLNVQELPSAIYIIKIYTDTGNISKKIIIR